MSLSPRTLWMTAYQWQKLTRFAGDLAAFPGGPPVADTNAASEAARYMRCHLEMTLPQWAEVEVFASVNRATLESAATKDSGDRFCAAEINGTQDADTSTLDRNGGFCLGSRHTIRF